MRRPLPICLARPLAFRNATERVFEQFRSLLKS